MSDTPTIEPRYYLLLLSIANPVNVNAAELRNRLELADDWFQYSPAAVLLWTRNPSHVWSHILRNNGGLGESSFIIYTLDPRERQGWMPNELWQWLDKIAPQGPRRRQHTFGDLLGYADKTQRRSLLEQLGLDPPKKP